MLDLELDVVRETEPGEPLGDERWAALARHVLAAEGAAGAWSVAVVLVDDARLQALHAEFMDIDEPTDVMTFPTGDPHAPGGDIVVSLDRAREQAPEFGLGFADEVRFLVVHGLLHLCDWDDATPEARARMLARGSELIASFAG